MVKEKILEYFINNSREGFLLLDKQGFVRYSNPASGEILGYISNEMMARHSREFVFSEDLAQMEELFEQLVHKKTPNKCVITRLLRKNGKICWVECYGANLLSDPDINGIIVHFRDVTDQIQFQGDIEQSALVMKTLFEKGPDPIFWADPDTGRLINCNDAAEELMEMPKNEILKIPYLELHIPEERSRIQQSFDQIIQTDPKSPIPTTTECTVISAKGTRHYIQIRGSFIKSEKLQIAQAIFHDITPLREMEQKLKLSEQKFATAFLTVPIILAISTLKEGIYLEVNKAFLEILGYSREDVIGKSSKELSIFANFTDRDWAIEILKREGIVRNLEVKIHTKHHEIRTVLFSVSKMSINDTPCLLVSANDITVLKKMEQEKQQNDMLLKNLFDNANDLIFTIDLQGHILSINKALQQLGEYTNEDVTKLSIFDVISPEYKELAKKMIQKKLQRETVNTVYELEGVTKSGRRILLEINTSVVFVNGQPVAIQGIGRDISARKQLDQEQLRTEKLESLAILAGGIAHDFNNILVAILGNINLMQMERDIPPVQRQMLQDLEIATRRASDLTKQLMTFAKGGEPLKVTATIDKIILDSANFILRGSNCKAIFNFSSSNVIVDVDIGQITQVINNLILNAAQSMQSGGIIHIILTELDENMSINLPFDPKRFIQISIADQGKGIPEEIRNKIFDPYFTTKKYGTGLGLATVYSIVRRHGGYITFESELNKGTTFNIFLPKSTKKILSEESQTTTKQNFKGNVLILDDDPHVQSILGKMLGKLGFTVDKASTGEEAVQMYKTGEYQVVIMDLTLPGGVGGKEVLPKLQEINPKIKAIVSSGYSDDDVMSNHTKYGFIGALKKPYTIDDLQQLLQKIL